MKSELARSCSFSLSFSFFFLHSLLICPIKVSSTVTGFASQHTPSQASRVTSADATSWLLYTLNELSNPYGTNVTFDASSNVFTLKCTTC